MSAVDSRPRAEVAANVLDWALWYAARSFPVVVLHCVQDGVCTCSAGAECRTPGKHPRTAHGLKEATTDEQTIRSLLERFPLSNLGILTGQTSGLLVVDKDPRNGGDESLAALEAAHGPLNAAVVQQTGGGGQHYLFKWQPHVRCGKIAPGLDRKGEGGYIVVHPSVTKSRYDWDSPERLLEGFEALSAAPAWALRASASQPKQDAPHGDKVAEGGRHDHLVSLAGTLRKRGESVESIEAMLLAANREICTPPLPDAEVREIARSMGIYPAGGDQAPWPELMPLPGDLPAVAKFQEAFLPPALSQYAVDIAERMQVPLDLPGAGLIVTLAGAVGRNACIQPKAKDDSWLVVPNVWGAIVAPPGYMKTAILAEVTRPLKFIEDGWRRTHEGETEGYARAEAQYKLRMSAYEADFKKAGQGGGQTPEQPVAPAKPRLRRRIVNDATFEALHATMAENPSGVLVLRDELSGWFSQLDKPGREGERAFCLEAWNGDGSHTIDRIGRGSLHAPTCCMSLFGGLQPGPLSEYILDTTKGGRGADGLVPRVQMLVYPDLSTEWSYVDRPPNTGARESVYLMFRHLVGLDGSPQLRFWFADDAQELFIEWLGDLERRLRTGIESPTLISHLSKYRSLMPKLALNFELADMTTAPGFAGFAGSIGGDRSNLRVSLQNTRRAAMLCEYLETHAVRAYSPVGALPVQAARRLGEEIRRRQIGAKGTFTLRELYQRGWSGLATPTDARQAVGTLEDAGWVRGIPSPQTSGRPSERYGINPGVWR